ncbi:MAG: outer membrane protein assembly factor BamE [Rhodobacteraceae bacterium]|nr:MAG: outer membrane protein assembly factor BamE [Paracoccaceae bacterium]
MRTDAFHLRRLGRMALVACLTLGLAGCVEQVRKHGYVPSEEDLAEIVVGVDTRDSVAETVGTPSSSGVLNEGGYYYVASRISTFGPREPRVIDREVVAISFNQQGVVENIERFGLQDGRVVQLSRRVTESSVSNRSFLRQLLGNLGNFNAGQFLNE